MRSYIRTIIGMALAACCALASGGTVHFGIDWAAKGFDYTSPSQTQTAVISQDGITFVLTATASPAHLVDEGSNAAVFGIAGDGSKDTLIDGSGESVTLTLAITSGMANLASLSLSRVSPGSFNGSSNPEGLTAWDDAGNSKETEFNIKNPVFTYADAFSGLNQLTLANIDTWELSLGVLNKSGVNSSYSIKDVVLDYVVGTGDTTPPAAPANLAATAIAAGVTLDWDANSEPDLASYSVYRSEVSGSGHVLVASGVSSNSYDDVPLPESTPYHYVVTATDTSGNESPASAEDSATTPADTIPISVPTGLTASGGGGVADLDWDDNPEADLTGYGVYRSDTADGTYTWLADVATSAHADGTVTDGTTYYYKLTAKDINGNESALSGWVDVTPSNVPQAPTNLTVVVSNSSVSLAWDDAGKTNLVYRKIGSGDFVLIATLSTSEHSFDDYGFGTGLTYAYRVTEKNSSGVESLPAEHVIAASTPPGTLDFSPVDPANRPNIILVMADDQGWGDTGYNGHYALQTPTMDSMAENGFVMNRFYAAPDCSPARASIFTGRQAVRSSVFAPGHYMRSYQESTLPKVLRNAGYVTGLFGKFHLGSGQADSPANPTAMGFDEWVIGLNYFDLDPFLSRMGVIERRLGEQGSVAITDDAIDFLDAHKNGGKPMFATVWFPAPHNPNSERCSDPNLYSGISGYSYFQEITLVDEQLGRIRQWLRDNNLEDNTILWYCSDNGGLRSESTGGRDKKGETYEGGLRVPSVMEWPARQLQGSSNIAAVTYDMYPTLLGLLGITVENQPPLDGIDLRGVIEGTVESRPGIGFWDNVTGGQGTKSDRILSYINGTPVDDPDGKMNDNVVLWRFKKEIYEFQPELAGHSDKEKTVWLEWPWKLHERDFATTYLLYNLETDPMETTDLSGDPAQAQRLADMKAALAAWKTSVLKSVNGADYAQAPTWLPMNHTAGFGADDADGSLRGVVTNTADSSSHWVAGRHNMALSLDGSDDLLGIENAYFLPPVGVNERTVSAWIRTTGAGVIASWGDVQPDEYIDTSLSGSLWQMSINNSGRLHLDVNSGSITGQADLRDGGWHHVAFVFANDGSPNVDDVLLYVDGNPESISASDPQAIATRNSLVTLGGNRSGSVITIDEFRIEPRALTAPEVAARYAATDQAAAAWHYRHYGTDNLIDWLADTDMDQSNSLVEYAFGTNPRVADVNHMPLRYNPASRKLEVSFARRRDGTHDLTYTVQVSDDMKTWNLPFSVISVDPHPELDAEEFEMITIESDHTIDEKTALFIRVAVIR